MKRMDLIAIAVVAPLMAGAVRADDLIVTGRRIVTGTIDGNLIVKSGGNAILGDALIHGDVIVEPGGSLRPYIFATGRTTIEGNVEGDGAVLFGVSLANTDILGHFYAANSIAVGLTNSSVAADFEVTSSGSVSVSSSTLSGGFNVSNISGNVRVSTSDISGDFKVTSAVFATLSDSSVSGSVKVTGAISVGLIRSDVGVDVKVTSSGTDGISSFFPIFIQALNVGGNVKLEDNFASSILVDTNLILGDVKVFNNMTLWSGPFEIIGNDISGDLKCGGNDPDPTLLDNVVMGDVKCAD